MTITITASKAWLDGANQFVWFYRLPHLQPGMAQ
jgi:hypothetical protein